ncbi:MAG: hypothetical protein LBG73_01390 [Spirochaetaceae bacterium]|jgi:hypothetical protein|nr:hypothetical protein [Spirochaetaceae bacterium]
MGLFEFLEDVADGIGEMFEEIGDGISEIFYYIGDAFIELWEGSPNTISRQVDVITNNDAQSTADNIKNNARFTKMIAEKLNSPHPVVYVVGFNEVDAVADGVKFEGNSVDNELKNRFGSEEIINVY